MQKPTVLDPRQIAILDGLDLEHTVGAEIGPLDKPVVQWQRGRVFYVDRSSTDVLKRHWSTDSTVDVSKIHVDAVWGQNSLKQAFAETAGSEMLLDYIVASHVIEHVPDLIGWLREIEECLCRPDGSLRLAIPDKRYTFDLLRTESSLVDVLDAHVRQRRVPSAACVLDFALYMASVDCSAAWNGRIDTSKLVHGYTQEQALALARDAEENGTYHDVHCWVFTPDSFVNLMWELSRRELIGLACRRLIPTGRNTIEFFAHLSPDPDSVSRTATWAETANCSSGA